MDLRFVVVALQHLACALVLAVVAGCGGGGGAAEPGTTPTPSPLPSPVSLAAVDTGVQTAAPGTGVAVVPVVVVRGASGQPLQGVAVRFTVTGGDGRVGLATATTDSDGRADCGSWTLGSERGLNTVSAEVAGLDPVVFTAKSLIVSPDVGVAIYYPGAGRTVGQSVYVSVAVTSTYQLAGVTASIAGRTVPLAFDGGPRGSQTWVADVDVGNWPRGTISLLATATDVFGNSTDQVVPLTLDRAPTVLVAAPLSGSLARPTVGASVTCADDDGAGCVDVQVRVNGDMLARGPGTVTGTLDLAAYEGRSLVLEFTGVDSAGQRSTVTRVVHVESSTRLVLRSTLEGDVWDLADTRALFLDSSAAVPALKLRDLGTAATTVLETTPDLAGAQAHGFLTPTGALYLRGRVDASVFPYHWIYEWRDGVLASLGGTDSAAALRVAGGWATFSAFGADTATYDLWRRDLVAGETTLVAHQAHAYTGDLTAGGEVAYLTSTAGTNIHRWREGSDLQLTFDPAGGTTNLFPVTDGVHVVYVRHGGACCGTGYRIAMNDGVTETLLTPTLLSQPEQYTGYAVAGGYVAYGVEDLTGTVQLWRHSAAGEQQITFLGSSSLIDAIAPDGTVVLNNRARRYVAVPGQPLKDVGSSLGRVVWRDGRFVVLLGPNILDLVP